MSTGELQIIRKSLNPVWLVDLVSYLLDSRSSRNISRIISESTYPAHRMIAEVTMEISFTSSLPLIFLMMTGATAQGWGVKYSSSSVCAVNGSTVKFSCDVEYPRNQELETVFWTKRAYEEHPELCSEERVQCITESKDRFSITLRDVREADKHIYYCRFITNAEGGRYTGIPGVLLDVTDLQVKTEQMVKEGDPVTMTCRTSCSLPPGTRFFWFRGDQRLSEQTKKKLQLQSARPSDTGFYQCAAVGAEHLRSPPVYLGVGRVEGLVESGVIYSSSSVCALKGTTVKITCSSSEHNILISKLIDTSSTAASKIIGIEHGEDFLELGSMSPVEQSFALDFNLQVETEQMVKEGDPVTMTCRTSCSLPPGTRFIWFRGDQRLSEQTKKKLQLQSARLSDTGFYQCAAQEAEDLRSPPVYLGVGCEYKLS
ncbi:hypothetical protein DNTS_030189 [Danionella cerebrum]|uniref:Ig-like domain-containing protein n=1 Tax=Danionella cerebrum TaxID=2873325 RepID=A0A553Q844_9TELE|nr:hypothetical protein DNTS_030189 [Danionella translucida]